MVVWGLPPGSSWSARRAWPGTRTGAQDRAVADGVGRRLGGARPRTRDLGPCLAAPLVGLTACVFVREELTLDVGIAIARARLVNMISDGSVRTASEGAYDDGIVTLMRVGPFGAVPGFSKLVRVRFMEVVTHEENSLLTLRWEATGGGGKLFPALDADITLEPVGEKQTKMILVGAYRPPLAGLGAGLDRAILGRVASATMRSLLGQLAAEIDPDTDTSAWAEHPEGG